MKSGSFPCSHKASHSLLVAVLLYRIWPSAMQGQSKQTIKATIIEFYFSIQRNLCSRNKEDTIFTVLCKACNYLPDPIFFINYTMFVINSLFLSCNVTVDSRASDRGQLYQRFFDRLDRIWFKRDTLLDFLPDFLILYCLIHLYIV